MPSKKRLNPSAVNSGDLDYGDRRVCIACRFPKMPAEFKTRAGGVYSMRCRVCQEQERDQKRRAKATAELDKKILKVLDTGTTTKAPHTAELAADIIRQLGGIEMYGMLLKHHLYAAMDKNLADPHVYKVLKGISEIVHQATLAGDAASDVSRESDEELLTNIRAALEQADEFYPDAESESA